MIELDDIEEKEASSKLDPRGYRQVYKKTKYQTEVFTTCCELSYRFRIGLGTNASVIKGTRENLKRRLTCMLQGLLWRLPLQELLVWEDFNEKIVLRKK